MNEILDKIVWFDKEPAIKEFVIYSPEISERHLAGQFVIVRIGERGERIPLTIADKSTQKGTISIVVQEVGKSTIDMGKLGVGDTILDIVGPLGIPTHVERFGTVVCVCGGIGVATCHPIAKRMKENGNNVISIIGARTKDILVYEEKMNLISDRVIVATDDGSYGQHGFVTGVLESLIKGGAKIDLVVTVGPPIMMKIVCEITKEYDIKTYASLNTVMLDGTGMCGACRVSIGGKRKFVCVDGPEFDGHLVDFDEMIHRMSHYSGEEQLSKKLCLKRTC